MPAFHKRGIISSELHTRAPRKIKATLVDTQPRAFAGVLLGGDQQILRHAGKMLSHGEAGRLGITTAQSLKHDLMLVRGRLNSSLAGAPEEIFAKGRLAPHVPQCLDNVDEHVVARAAGKGEVESPVRLLAFGFFETRIANSDNEGFEFRYLRVRYQLCCQGSDFTFE